MIFKCTLTGICLGDVPFIQCINQINRQNICVYVVVQVVTITVNLLSDLNMVQVMTIMIVNLLRALNIVTVKIMTMMTIERCKHVRENHARGAYRGTVSAESRRRHKQNNNNNSNNKRKT